MGYDPQELLPGGGEVDTYSTDPEPTPDPNPDPAVDGGHDGEFDPCCLDGAPAGDDTETPIDSYPACSAEGDLESADAL